MDIIGTKPPKRVVWIGDTRNRVRSFPDAARARTGFELWEVQQGKEPSDWKPMPSVGIGVTEIRVHAEGEYRVLYVAKFAEAVYVLHAFGKKSRKTAPVDIELARARYRTMLKERRQR
jgi:phage-related protein